MNTSPVSPAQQRASRLFQKALGARLAGLYSIALAEPPPEGFLHLLAEADRIPTATAPSPSTTARSRLTLFG